MAPPNVSNPPLPPVGAGRANTNPADAALVALSNPGDSWVWDFQNLVVYNQAPKKTNRRAATDAWMASERNWRNRVGKGWVAKRLLGRGTYGVVGHWSYEGSDRDSKSLKDVAVKQSLRFPFPLGGFGLQFEATNLSELGRAKSQHIVRMYRHLYEEVGQRTNKFDMGLVHRIFLEYCPGGDAGNWIREHLYNNTTISEAQIWAIFHCLARACLIMHHGSEDATAPTPGWPQQELVHLDLKLENVLVGAPTTDVEHRDMSPFKFGDLGNGRRVPAIQSPQFLRDHSEFGTPEYFAPEQVIRKDHLCGPRPWFDFIGNCTVEGVRYGTATNVWQVGLIMHCLMCRSHYPIWGTNSIDRLRCYKSILSDRLRGGGDTIGNSTDRAFEFNPNMSAYSVELRTLLHECLLINPYRRPPPSEVVQRTQQAIDLMRMSMGLIIHAPFIPYSEPRLSARWYSGQNNGNPAKKPPPLTPAQISAADKLHDAKITLERENLKEGISQARVSNAPSPPPNPPVAPNLPTPIPAPVPAPASTATVPAAPDPGSGTGAELQSAMKTPLAPPQPTPAAMPVPAAPAPVLHKVTQVTCIVQTKNFFGNFVFKNYTINNLTPETLVIDVKRTLVAMGCGITQDKQIWMNGRTLMSDYMKLGEFANLVGGRNTVRVTSR